jgi:transcriptional/translational regulatory protein YebC/TACO1
MRDEYSPSEKPERTHRQDNHERHYQTKSEDDLGAILARLSRGSLPWDFRVNGGVHKQRKKSKRDERQKELLEALGYWVEDVENRDVKQAHIFTLLESHRRTIA